MWILQMIKQALLAVAIILIVLYLLATYGPCRPGPAPPADTAEEPAPAEDISAWR